MYMYMKMRSCKRAWCGMVIFFCFREGIIIIAGGWINFIREAHIDDGIARSGDFSPMEF